MRLDTDTVLIAKCLQASVQPLSIKTGVVAGEVRRVLKVKVDQIAAPGELRDQNLSLLGPTCGQNDVLREYLLPTELTEHG